MVTLDSLLEYLKRLLDTPPRKDYCPNGLQVGGKNQIQRLATAVTASLEAIEAAITAKADALLVHHGIFWNQAENVLVGARYTRVKRLIEAHMPLVAYHLPLDYHPQFGNNALLGQRLQIDFVAEECAKAEFFTGCLTAPLTGELLKERLEQLLGRTPLWFKGKNDTIKSVAWCSGAGHSFLESAARMGYDAFITGELNLPSYDLAQEYGIHVFAGGHHATERLGVQALGEHLAEKFGIEHIYLELSNPL